MKTIHVWQKTGQITVPIENIDYIHGSGDLGSWCYIQLKSGVKIQVEPSEYDRIVKEFAEST